MKKQLLSFALVFGLMLSMSLKAEVQSWKQLDSQISNKTTAVNLLESNDNLTRLEFNFNAYAFQQVQTAKGVANFLKMPNCVQTQQKGAPQLPQLAKAIVIPNTAKMAVKVVKSNFVEFKNIDIAPSKGIITRDKNPNDFPFVYGKEYSENKFYPSEIAKLNDPYIIRNVRGQSVVVSPVQYNPVTKVLRVYTNVMVEIVNTGKEGKNILQENPKAVNDEVFNSVLTNQFINYRPNNSKYTPISESGKKMLIVCYSSFMDEMQAYVNWKQSIGYTVTMVDYSTIGSSSALKTYVKNQYTQNGISYLLLVGDHQQVPSYNASAGYSDNTYGYTSGTDHYLDVFVGRFSAETSAQVQTQIDRTIYYERDLDGSASWIKKAVGIASNEGTGGGGDNNESDEQHMNNIQVDLEGYGYTVNRVYQDGGSASQLSSSLNNGRGVINYVGHGSNTSWASMVYTQSNVNSLTNDNKLPFVFSVACVVGNFTGQTCFAETWLRATHNGNPTGAIAFCGSTINQSWASPMRAQDEMDDLLVANNYITYGGVFVNGLFKMIDVYNTDGENMADTWTVFGDPSVQMRTPGHPNGPQGSVVNPPVADFNANVTTINEGESVTFSNLSTNNPTQYSWTFEGGTPSTSSDKNPTVTYNTQGVYKVTLVATNTAGSNTKVKNSYITVNKYVPQYCSSNGQNVNYEWINKVVVGSLSHTSAANGGYADFTSTNANLTAGSTVNVTLTPGFKSSSYSEYWKIWIDYNNDKDFEDAGEEVFSSNGKSAVSGSFTIKSSASGSVRMRISMKYNAAPSPCESFTYGEVEDYTVSFSGVVAPVADFTANKTTINEGQSVSFTDLSSNNPTSWSWSFTGGTPSTSTQQNPTVTYNTEGTYKVVLTASNAGGSNTKTKTGYITVNKVVSSYCASKGGNVSYEWIQSVAFGSFSNNSGANGGYADFTSKTVNLTPGQAVNVTLTPGFASSSYSEYWQVWIDYNKDGDFNDSGETFTSGNGSGELSGSVTVPSTASGTTRMRISMKYNAAPTACESFSYGEVEDYTVSFGARSDNRVAEIENAISVYPQPADDVLHIKLSNETENLTIKMYNMNGQLVNSVQRNGNTNNIDLDVSQQAPGFYTIQIIAGNKITNQRVIIK